jgi:hypothetical protein
MEQDDFSWSPRLNIQWHSSPMPPPLVNQVSLEAGYQLPSASLPGTREGCKLEALSQAFGPAPGSYTTSSQGQRGEELSH